MRLRRRARIILTHDRGCAIEILLPADMEAVGSAIEALGREGFEIPAARGKKTMTMIGDFGRATIPLPSPSGSPEQDTGQGG